MVDLLDIVCFYELFYVFMDGGDGLKFYKWFMEDLFFVMKDKVFVVFEIGYNQGKVVEDLFCYFFLNVEVEVVKDINGKDRIVLVVIKL